MGITQKFVPVNYHQNTGLIERCIGTLYKLFKTNLLDNVSESTALARTLFTMRGMKHKILKCSPFEAHFGRPQPNRLNNKLLKPSQNLLDWTDLKLRLHLLDQERETIEHLQAAEINHETNSQEIVEEIRNKWKSKDHSQFGVMPRGVVKETATTITVNNDKGLFVNLPKSQCAFLPETFRQEAKDYEKKTKRAKKSAPNEDPIQQIDSSDDNEPLDRYLIEKTQIDNANKTTPIDV